MLRLLILLYFLAQISVALADYEYKPGEEAARKLSVAAAKRALSSLEWCNSTYRNIFYAEDIRLFELQVLPDFIRLRGLQTGDTWIIQFREMRDIYLEYTSRFGDTDYLYLSFTGHVRSKGKNWSGFKWDCDQILQDRVMPYQEKAKILADALLRLKLDFDEANGTVQQEKFLGIVAQYITANPKPELPEAVRRFRIQAEQAIAGKRLLEAVDKYREALKIAPWWPEGYFNIALVLAETQNFDSAITAMKRYLLLRRDGPDARLAQDKIYSWEAYPYE